MAGQDYHHTTSPLPSSTTTTEIIDVYDYLIGICYFLEFLGVLRI